VEYFKTANEYYRKGKYEQAISIYNKAFKEGDNEISSIHNIALCYIKLKQYNRAIPLLRVVVTKKTKGEYFFNLAYAYLMVKNFKKALAYINTAWTLSPYISECESIIKYILKTYRKDVEFGK
jgi:tetratricopeptide (TPR) repeat protein